MQSSNLHYDWLREEHGIRLRPEQTTNVYPKDVSIRLQELRQGNMGKRQIGLDGYREAVRKWPDNPDAKLMLIGALFQREKEEEARQWLETALFFPIHAIRLLGILRATETLPDILDYLRMEEGFFEFWFGDFADRYILPALYFFEQRPTAAPL